MTFSIWICYAKAVGEQNNLSVFWKMDNFLHIFHHPYAKRPYALVVLSLSLSLSAPYSLNTFNCSYELVGFYAVISWFFWILHMAVNHHCSTHIMYVQSSIASQSLVGSTVQIWFFWCLWSPSLCLLEDWLTSVFRFNFLWFIENVKCSTKRIFCIFH